MKRTTGLVATALLLLCGCNETQTRLSQYTGDGQLQYLRGPLLGCDGWRITLPSFDLAEGITTNYSLTGLPAGDQYTVYLVVSNPCPMWLVTRGVWSFTLDVNNRTIRQMKAPMSEMINAADGEKNCFWFYRKHDRTADVYEYAFAATNASDNIRLSVSYHNDRMTVPVRAFVSVERGGYK